MINVVWKREIINLCDVDEKMEPICKYSKTCLKRSLKTKQNKGLKDKW